MLRWCCLGASQVPALVPSPSPPPVISPASILGPEGRIAARLPSYEHRPQQLAMAEAVERALVDGQHLVVEAGTGVGKSFAYLVPAIAYVTAEPPPEASDDDEETNCRLARSRRSPGGGSSSPRTRSACRSNSCKRTCRCCGA